MQGRNGDADVENGLLDTVGEGESGTNGKSSINIFKLDNWWEIAHLLSIYSTRSPAWQFVMIKGWDIGRGRRIKMHNYDWFTLLYGKNNTTLQSNFPPIKKFKKSKCSVICGCCYSNRFSSIHTIIRYMVFQNSVV